MKIKHHEIEIPQENPFANCKLAREPYARVLTDIVNTYADGFVLAINNEWGAGKTTFVKMWQQQLENEGFQTIYFNAWENDFDSNPLVALMSELETLTNAKNKEVFKSVVEKGAVLIKNVAPAILKAVANKYIESKVITDAIENTTKASTEILEEEIKEYTSKKKTIVEFRNELEKFVKQADNSKPLIFIVDELDRCRPNYSVEVLEQIKHFFSVSGIVFVLSIDKNHLASAVKGFYGSEQIDSNEYLRRFIDLEYSIPEPKTEDFVNYLYDYYEFDAFFLSSERSRNSRFQSDEWNFRVMASLLLDRSNATLRQQERIFSHCRLIMASFNTDQYVYSPILFTLVYLKILHNKLYKKIKMREISVLELSDIYFSLVESFHTITEMNLLYIEAMLLWFYNNDFDHKERIELIQKDELNNNITSVKSKLDTSPSCVKLLGYFSGLQTNLDFDRMGLRYLIKRIELTEAIKTV